MYDFFIYYGSGGNIDEPSMVASAGEIDRDLALLHMPRDWVYIMLFSFKYYNFKIYNIISYFRVQNYNF
jgi:hypothetical protein